MDEMNPRYTFDPVSSRRLGKSLGINNVSARACTYSCMYCQAGKTSDVWCHRSVFNQPEDILREVEIRLTDASKKSEPVDYLVFVPDGEPALDRNLGTTIKLLKPFGIPVGIITNASMMRRPDVREDFCRADWVSLKVDAVQNATWRRINRPHFMLRLGPILDGMLRFANDFSGELVTETMIVRGVNDGRGSIKQVTDFLSGLQPHTAYLSIPARTPAEKRTSVPDESVLFEMFQSISEKVKHVEFLIGCEGDVFVSTGDVPRDLLSIAAVQPMREGDVFEEIL
jgi:wyosine [tRNA(Phe)-imidazoG37] synthetase (radical SAM superfamily)